MDCPMCGGTGMLLGQLGHREHYRCRDCGMDYSIDAASEPVTEW
jgi:tRNA(Ile2) C34 agmatinyltransferase TiaS